LVFGRSLPRQNLASMVRVAAGHVVLCGDPQSALGVWLWGVAFGQLFDLDLRRAAFTFSHIPGFLPDPLGGPVVDLRFLRIVGAKFELRSRYSFRSFPFLLFFLRGGGRRERGGRLVVALFFFFVFFFFCQTESSPLGASHSFLSSFFFMLCGRVLF